MDSMVMGKVSTMSNTVSSHSYVRTRRNPGPALLRPLTPGKRFLLFLPDSHSAYYDSFVSALGRSLPPSLDLSRICCTSPVSGGNGITHPRLQHWVKWLWERVWDFSALSGPTSSVSRRVVKLTVSHYYSAPLPLQKTLREAMGTKSETLSCS